MTKLHLKRGILTDSHTLLPDAAPLVIGDPNTLAACGWTYDTPYFTTPPKATKAQADTLAHAAQHASSILAIGSGTINDLCKMAAHQCGIPYAVIATAPSMNGYLSPNASLLHAGHKQSFAATAPRAVIADPDILAAAPTRLIQSGIGDTLCRSTVLTDVMLSHALCDTPDYHDAFSAMAQDETALLDTLEGEGDYSEALFNCLLTSGQAMADAGSSAPASQGEHMIAHLLEMFDPTLSARHYHGEIIAVTTLTMARLQEHIPSSYAKTLFPHKVIAAQCGEALAEQWHMAYEAKWASIYTTRPLPLLPKNRLDADRLETILKRAGCPTHPRDLGIDTATYTHAVTLARFSRDRFTALDLADASLLEYVSAL